MKNFNRIGLAWRRGLECAGPSPRDKKDQLDAVFVAQVAGMQKMFNNLLEC